MNYIGRLGFKSPVKTLLSSIQGKPYKKLALSNKWFSYRYGLLVLDVFHLHRSKMDIDLDHVFPDRVWEFVISKIYILMSNSVLCDSSNYSHILINKLVERCNDEAIKAFFFLFMKQVDATLPSVCSVIDHRVVTQRCVTNLTTAAKETTS